MTLIPFSAVEELRLAPECWARLQAYLDGAYRKPAALQSFITWILTQVPPSLPPTLPPHAMLTPGPRVPAPA